MPRHLRVAAVALSASLLAVGAAPANAEDELDALVAAPFTSQLVSGGKGTVVAWTVRERGARNVWVARDPALAPEALTSHREDHGDDDVNVEFQQTTDLAHRLRRLGRAPVEVLALPDEVHFLLRDQSYLRMFRATHEFLDRHLRPVAPAAQ